MKWQDWFPQNKVPGITLLQGSTGEWITDDRADKMCTVVCEFPKGRMFIIFHQKRALLTWGLMQPTLIPLLPSHTIFVSNQLGTQMYYIGSSTLLHSILSILPETKSYIQRYKSIFVLQNYFLLYWYCVDSCI